MSIFLIFKVTVLLEGYFIIRKGFQLLIFLNESFLGSYIYYQKCDFCLETFLLFDTIQ